MPKVPNKATTSTTAGLPNKRRREEKSVSIIELAEQGKYECILKMFSDDGNDINDLKTHAANADTPLHIAASLGHIETVCVLSGILLNLQMTGYRMRTPLHCSAANGHTLVTRRFLEAGAEVDAKDADGLTALHLAEKNEHADVVLFLAKNGANITEHTILLAISKGNTDLVELCLQRGQSVDKITNNESLVAAAARQRRWDIVSLLLQKGADPKACKVIKESPIVYAAQDGNVKAVRELLKHGVKSDNGQVKCALMAAKDQDVVYCISEHAPQLLKDPTITNFFLNSAAENRLGVLKPLCNLGVNINCTNTKNETALYLASEKGHDQSVDVLIDKHADLNIKNQQGNTALHAAAKSGHLKCVRMLLDAGAKPMEKNKSRKTPFDVAKTEEIRKMLPPPEKKTRTRVNPALPSNNSDNTTCQSNRSPIDLVDLADQPKGYFDF